MKKIYVSFRNTIKLTENNEQKLESLAIKAFEINQFKS